MILVVQANAWMGITPNAGTATTEMRLNCCEVGVVGGRERPLGADHGPAVDGAESEDVGVGDGSVAPTTQNSSTHWSRVPGQPVANAACRFASPPRLGDTTQAADGPSEVTVRPSVAITLMSTRLRTPDQGLQ